MFCICNWQALQPQHHNFNRVNVHTLTSVASPYLTMLKPPLGRCTLRMDRSIRNFLTLRSHSTSLEVSYQIWALFTLPVLYQLPQFTPSSYLQWIRKYIFIDMLSVTTKSRVLCQIPNVRLGSCFTPYQRLWLYNGTPLVTLIWIWEHSYTTHIHTIVDM